MIIADHWQVQLPLVVANNRLPICVDLLDEIYFCIFSLGLFVVFYEVLEVVVFAHATGVEVQSVPVDIARYVLLAIVAQVFIVVEFCKAMDFALPPLLVVHIHVLVVGDRLLNSLQLDPLRDRQVLLCV